MAKSNLRWWSVRGQCAWITLLGGFILGAHAQAAFHGKVYSTSERKWIDTGHFISELSNSSEFVLGEKHYTTEVQNAEGWLIRQVVGAKQAAQLQAYDCLSAGASSSLCRDLIRSHKEHGFTLAWEFLNWSERDRNQKAFEKLTLGLMTPLDFFAETFGVAAAPQSVVYAPMIVAAAELGGHLFSFYLYSK